MQSSLFIILDISSDLIKISISDSVCAPQKSFSTTGNTLQDIQVALSQISTKYPYYCICVAHAAPNPVKQAEIIREIFDSCSSIASLYLISPYLASTLLFGTANSLVIVIDSLCGVASVCEGSVVKQEWAFLNEGIRETLAEFSKLTQPKASEQLLAEVLIAPGSKAKNFTLLDCVFEILLKTEAQKRNSCISNIIIVGPVAMLENFDAELLKRLQRSICFDSIAPNSAFFSVAKLPEYLESIISSTQHTPFIGASVFIKSLLMDSALMLSRDDFFSTGLQSVREKSFLL